MFERGPNGYLFEYMIWDDIFFIILGTLIGSLGIYLILHENKLNFMAPIVGLFCMAFWALPGAEIMYLLGIPT